MAQNIDQPILYDALVKKDTFQMSDVWIGWFSNFIQVLQGYLTQNGILLPQLTTSQRDALQNVPNGQIIYNTTINSAQYYKAGTWTSI